MTEGIRIKHLSKILYDNTRRDIVEISGPAQNQSVRTQDSEGKLLFERLRPQVSLEKPDARKVTDPRALNGLTPLELAASYMVRWRSIITLALVGYVYSRLTYYSRDWHTLTIVW